MTDELPPGWAKSPLGKLGDWLGGGTPSKAVSEYWRDGTVHWVSPKDMKRPLIDSAQDQITERAVKESATNLVPANSVLMVTRSGILEHSFPVAVNTVPVTMNQDLKAVAIRGVDPIYTSYFLQSRAQDILRTCKKDGTTVSSIDTDRLAAYEIVVAPAAEQKRIVSKIDELFSRIDEGERALQRVSVLVERYRQSVLKAAVTGDLTRAWREKNKDALESGEALLARILTARREAWEKAELEKMKAKGITPVDGKWKQKYREPSPPDSAELPDLPNGWAWASLDQLTSKITSGSRDWKDYYGRGKSVFVMAQNVRPRRLDFAEVQWVDPPPGDRDAERSEVRQHDLLVTIVGANTGDVCRVPTSLMRHYVCQSVALARPVLPTLSVFLELYLAADEGGQAKFAEVIYGAGRPHLSFDQLREIAIPLPPIAEQEAACSTVDLIESEIQAVTSGIATAGRSSSALRQATLRSAFSGMLVQQDPADEPASSLLARIAAERTTDTATPKRGRKKKPAT